MWQSRNMIRRGENALNISFETRLLKAENKQPRTHSQSESIRTTSMENVSTGVLEKNEEHYLGSKDKAEKWYDVSRYMQLHMSKYKKYNKDILSIMSNLQPNCCLKVDFQKVDQHTHPGKPFRLLCGERAHTGVSLRCGQASGYVNGIGRARSCDKVRKKQTRGSIFKSPTLQIA